MAKFRISIRRSLFIVAFVAIMLAAAIELNGRMDPRKAKINKAWSDTEPPFIVVSSKYGRTAGATRNPNEFLHSYLRGEVQDSMLIEGKKLLRNSR